MKKKLLTAIFVSSLCGSMQAQDAPHGYPYSPVPFTSVKMTDSFWGQRLKASREVTIPLAFSKCEESGRYENFVKAAHPSENYKVEGLPFDDTDVYKTIEGASYLLQTYPDKKLQKYIEEGTVQIAPLAYMRGRTLDNAFVILDEAQNTTLPQIKMFLTRMGRNAKFIVTGDVTQIDLPRRSDSGLTRAMEILRGVEGIGIVEFDRRDIVRHPLVKQIVEAFDRSAAVEAAPAPENGK